MHSLYALLFAVFIVFVFKQKTADEWRISDLSSDVCSSDLFAAERRIARAKALLAERSSSERGPAIKEIAYRCGFETAAAFSVAFRRATGVTPRQYRLNVRS